MFNLNMDRLSVWSEIEQGSYCRKRQEDGHFCNRSSRQKGAQQHDRKQMDNNKMMFPNNLLTVGSPPNDAISCCSLHTNPGDPHHFPSGVLDFKRRHSSHNQLIWFCQDRNISNFLPIFSPLAAGALLKAATIVKKKTNEIPVLTLRIAGLPSREPIRAETCTV